MAPRKKGPAAAGKMSVVCTMCGETRKKMPPCWELNDAKLYCGACWQTVVCTGCNHHDPKGAFVQGRWRCRACRHKQRGPANGENMTEACHQLIMDDHNAEAGYEEEEAIAKLPDAPALDDEDEEDEEYDEIAPLRPLVAPKATHQKPVEKPNHVVMLLDASGSMRTVDVLQDEAAGSGGSGVVCRLEAAVQCAADFAAAHAKMHPHDVFSVAVVRDATEVICTALSAPDMREALEKVPVRGSGGTFYRPAIATAAELLGARPSLPGHVLILSDGRPADTKAALELFQESFVHGQHGRAHVHGIGFGVLVESFAALQQLTCLSSGSFQLAGCSVRGLCRAFSTVSSTITSMSTGDLGEQAAEASKSRVPRPADFESPEQGVFGKKGTLHFRAARASFRFDGQTFYEQKWSSGEVVRRVRPYMRGGMRLVYGLSDAQVNTQGSWMVAKCSRFLDEALNTRAAVAVHAKSTAVARYFATRFNDRNRAIAQTDNQAKAPVLFFVPCFVYDVEGADESSAGDAAGAEPRHFAAERFLPGVFLKYNSNNGYVAEGHVRHHEAIQAFMHFTYSESDGRLLVADLQGVARSTEAILTDPQVLSPERGFGPGDLGTAGMRMCLAAHRCGPTCRRLGLQPVSAAQLRKLGGAAPAGGAGGSDSSCASWEKLGPARHTVSGADSAESASWERVSDSGAQHFSLSRGGAESSQASTSSWVHVMDM